MDLAIKLWALMGTRWQVILRAPVIPPRSDLLRSAKINGFLQYITEVSVWPANKRNRKEMVPLLAPIHHSLERPRKKMRFFRFVFVPRPSQSSAISPKRMLGPGHEARVGAGRDRNHFSRALE